MFQVLPDIGVIPRKCIKERFMVRHIKGGEALEGMRLLRNSGEGERRCGTVEVNLGDIVIDRF